MDNNNPYKGFLYSAYNDALVVEKLSEEFGTFPEMIAFHAQQCAEKNIKAVFTKRGRVPSKIHQLDSLLNEAVENGWIEASEDEVLAASILAQYAVKARYVSAREIGRGEALEAIIYANDIASMVARNGYTAVRINVKAAFLHDKELSLRQIDDIRQPEASIPFLDGDNAERPDVETPVIPVTVEPYESGDLASEVRDALLKGAKDARTSEHQLSAAERLDNVAVIAEQTDELRQKSPSIYRGSR